jgi:hypothetical protein
MGVAALVLAISGLLVSWIPFVGLLSVLLGLLAVVLGSSAGTAPGRAGPVWPCPSSARRSASSRSWWACSARCSSPG